MCDGKFVKLVCVVVNGYLNLMMLTLPPLLCLLLIVCHGCVWVVGLQKALVRSLCLVAAWLPSIDGACSVPLLR